MTQKQAASLLGRISKGIGGMGKGQGTVANMGNVASKGISGVEGLSRGLGRLPIAGNATSMLRTLPAGAGEHLPGWMYRLPSKNFSQIENTVNSTGVADRIPDALTDQTMRASGNRGWGNFVPDSYLPGMGKGAAAHGFGAIAADVVKGVKGLNPGGAEAALSPALKSISKTNNSRAAFMAMNKGKLPGMNKLSAASDPMDIGKTMQGLHYLQGGGKGPPPPAYGGDMLPPEAHARGSSPATPGWNRPFLPNYARSQAPLFPAAASASGMGPGTTWRPATPVATPGALPVHKSAAVRWQQAFDFEMRQRIGMVKKAFGALAEGAGRLVGRMGESKIIPNAMRAVGRGMEGLGAAGERVGQDIVSAPGRFRSGMNQLPLGAEHGMEAAEGGLSRYTGGPIGPEGPTYESPIGPSGQGEQYGEAIGPEPMQGPSLPGSEYGSQYSQPIGPDPMQGPGLDSPNFTRPVSGGPSAWGYSGPAWYQQARNWLGGAASPTSAAGRLLYGPSASTLHLTSGAGSANPLLGSLAMGRLGIAGAGLGAYGANAYGNAAVNEARRNRIRQMNRWQLGLGGLMGGPEGVIQQLHL